MSDTPIVIAKQGIFSAGGIVEHNPGTFEIPVIPDADSEVPAWDFWRGVKALAYKFADAVNAHGGDCAVICLPDEGIKGNDHFMFQDLNNQDVADSMAGWLKEKGLA